MQETNDDKKMNVTTEQAKQWIKNHNQDINPNQWRSRYFEKIGLSVETTQESEIGKEDQMDLQKQEQFENDKYYINFFSERTYQQIRNRYYSKLMIYENREEEEKPRQKNQHIFIYDWDDTILCTTYLSSFQFLDIGNQAKALMQKLDDSGSRLIDRSIQKSEKIFIITNAAKGWVEYSSKIYLPKVHSLIMNKKIRIISARSLFGEEYPGDFSKWKVEAFKTIGLLTRNLLTNLICIGDSNIEMEAAHTLSREFDHSLVKTIKFRENPKPDELIKQQELVFERMKEIFQSTKNLTIRLERKSSKPKKAHS